MPQKKLEKFGGMLPQWEAHLLPDGQAANASNCYLFSGALTGWRQPSLLRALTNPAAKFAYRLPNVTQSVAFAYLIFKAQPVAGDTVTLGDDVYTWDTFIGVGSPAFRVLIGATAVASATNLLNAFTFDNGAGTNQNITYSNNTTVNGAIATLNEVPGQNNGLIGSTILVISPDIGAAYNATPVAESTAGVRTFWSSTSPALTATTTFTGGTNAVFDPTITSPSSFLEFVDQDTSVTRSQVVADQFQRFYFVSPSVEPQYNTTARINAGKAPWVLGIPAPGCAPSVSVGGGGNYGTQGNTAPTLGTPTAAGGNIIYLLPIVPTGAIQITDVKFGSAVTDINANWQTLIYEDLNQGVGSTPTGPGQLINASPTFTGLTAGVNAVGAFTNPSGLNQGVVYWVGFWIDRTEQVQTVTPGAANMMSFVDTFTNGPPVNAPPATASLPMMKVFMDFQTQDVIEARAYVYTWISAYGEESPPSPFTLVNGWSNGVWSISLFNPPADELGIVRNLAVARLYRTVTGNTGLTTYYQIADISLGSSDQDAINFVAADANCLPPSTLYTDQSADNVVALQVQLPSTNYFPPPADLVGFITLPNGMVAGWKKNEIWFCEPYFPHAWPPGYVLAVDTPVVGLGVTSGAIVICTSATPYVANGTAPGQMSLFKCVKPEPCTSRGSIVSLESGVHYISPNGLIMVPNTGQLSNITDSWIKREDWAALVPLKNARAIALVGSYFCWGTTNGSDVSQAQTGFTIELNADTTSFTIWPQAGGHRIGFMPMTSPLGFNIDNVLIDPWSGQGVLIMNRQEYWYDFTNASPVIQPYDWLSKKYQEMSKKNFSALRVFCTVPSTTPPQNAVANTAPANDPSWATLQSGQWGIVKVWADPNDGSNAGVMQVVMARELTKNGQLMRLPDGFKAENWQVEVLGRVVISNIQLATSVQELGKV